jgi:outer membrane protein OmpA-like peptidoglycan-associated protein
MAYRVIAGAKTSEPIDDFSPSASSQLSRGGSARHRSLTRASFMVPFSDGTAPARRSLRRPTMQRTLVVSILLMAASANADERRRSPAAPQASEHRRTGDGDSLAVVTFERRSTRVSDNALDRITDIAAWHADHPDSLLFIEAHDARAGSWTKNLRLSQRRTDAVREALVEAGADPNRMVLVARGDNRAGGKRAKGRVVIRASGQFTELALEQRDPQIGEDARAARRATMNDQRTRSGTADRGGGGAGRTVVVVPGGGGTGAGTNQRGSTVNGTNVDVAGGAGRTSGGAGTSAQTGIGDDPEARETAGAGGTSVVGGATGTGGAGAGATGGGGTGAGTAAGAAGPSGGIGATGTGATGSGVGATGTGATGGGTTGSGATGATGTGGPGAGTTSGTGGAATGGRGGATGAGPGGSGR